MTYFLDFDRTLFDTESFLPYLAGIPELARLKTSIHAVLMKGRGLGLAPDEDREELWKTINELYQNGEFEMKEDDLSAFVFPDAVQFLKQHGKQSVLVTSAGVDPAFQKGKVSRSGIGGAVAHVEYVVAGGPKGPVIQNLSVQYPGPYVFVDDLVAQIDSVVASNPDIQAYEMRRDGGTGSGKYPVIRSFAELV